jgi:hypothetical protein
MTLVDEAEDMSVIHVLLVKEVALMRLHASSVKSFFFCFVSKPS